MKLCVAPQQEVWGCYSCILFRVCHLGPLVSWATLPSFQEAWKAQGNLGAYDGSALGVRLPRPRGAQPVGSQEPYGCPCLYRPVGAPGVSGVDPHAHTVGCHMRGVRCPPTGGGTALFVADLTQSLTPDGKPVTGAPPAEPCPSPPPALPHRDPCILEVHWV